METVIKISNLYKEYTLGLVGYGTLSKDLQSWFAKIRGKEDPNSLLGSSRSNNTINNKIMALSDINLEIKEGEILGLIGANGSGKSTLLKILSKITLPSKGEVKIKGSLASLLEVGTGFHPELTAKENIYLNGAINGMGINQVKNKIDEIVEFANIEKFIDTPVKRFSSGMYVRLGFAVAAHLYQDILAIDEILAVGDKEFREKALRKVHELKNEENRTIIFVSHNMKSIQSLCSRVILLDKGKLIKSGKPSEVIADYYQSLKNLKLDEFSFLNDRKFRRGNGKVRFSEIGFFDSQKNKKNIFRSEEKVIFKFSYNVFENLKDLYVKIGFKSMKTGEVIAHINHKFEEKDLVLKKKHSFEIAFNINSLVQNSYNIYLWLGQSGVKGQCDIIDNLLPPIILENEKNLDDETHIILESEIKKI